MKANRHPIDELADVRAEMKRLKAREEEIRDSILSDQCELTGDQFSASIIVGEQKRFDADGAKRLLGPEKVAALTKTMKVRVVRLSERLMPDDV